MNETFTENYDKKYVVAQLVDVLKKALEKKAQEENDETEAAA